MPVSDSKEFQLYLDCVIKSGDRTRSVWYLLILLLIALFFGEWNTRIGSVGTERYVKFLDALVCVSDKDWKPLEDGPSCQEAVEYARIRHHFPDAINGPVQPNPSTKTILIQELQKRTEDLMRREFDSHIISVPILGVSIDGNDLWLLSSIIMIFVLRILWACLEREFDNMRRICSLAIDKGSKELIIMSQLLAVPTRRWHPLPVLLFLPIALNLFEIYTTQRSFHVGDLLSGRAMNWSEFIFHVLLIVPIGYLCYQCYQTTREIEKLIAKLAK